MIYSQMHNYSYKKSMEDNLQSCVEMGQQLHAVLKKADMLGTTEMVKVGCKQPKGTYA